MNLPSETELDADDDGVYMYAYTQHSYLPAAAAADGTGILTLVFFASVFHQVWNSILFFFGK